MKILKMDKDTFERFLADSLIGLNNSLGLNGISYGLMKNLNRIKQIEHSFYKEALLIVNSLNISIKPGTVKNIENEPIFQNPIILDKNGRAFEVTKFKKLYLKK